MARIQEGCRGLAWSSGRNEKALARDQKRVNDGSACSHANRPFHATASRHPPRVPLPCRPHGGVHHRLQGAHPACQRQCRVRGRQRLCAERTATSCGHPDIPEEACRDLWATVAAGKPWSDVVKNRHKNGDHYWVVAHVTPLLGDSRPVDYLSVRSLHSLAQIDKTEGLYAAR
ncbi:hypothetical protein DBR42_15165 [Pelomonas sp. HMWF004]|nr:hypothetical protein DBR42_15165 [Pelomonas sp. HMWF004]